MNLLNSESSTNRAKNESDLSEIAFARISKLAHKHAGIVISETKKSMVKSRLTRRLRATKISTFDAYLDYLNDTDDSEEFAQFISALTTNVSHFFREEHHFKYLTEKFLPLLNAKLQQGERVRIWSAGCSNGQEPYSIAITLLENIPNAANYDLKILATDIDPQVLATAQAGIYATPMCSGLTEAQLTKHFQARETDQEKKFHVNKSVKELCSFKQLNLHDSWPMQGQFDLIFCRNVIIYFNETDQEALFSKFSKKLSPNGCLFLGHSERLSGSASEMFNNAGITTYQKKPDVKNYTSLGKQ